MDKEFKITKKQLQRVADYKPKPFPKYSASIINLLTDGHEEQHHRL